MSSFLVFAVILTGILSAASNIIIKNHVSTQSWWLSFDILNAHLSCGGEISKVEIKDSGYYSSWYESNERHRWYGFISNGHEYTTPISIRITNEQGETIIGNDIITTWTGGQQFDFGSNFCAPATTTSTTSTTANNTKNATTHAPLSTTDTTSDVTPSPTDTTDDVNNWLDEFDHNTYLDPEEHVHLYWTNINDEQIEFGLEVHDCTGWIALGFSPNGLMPASDIMIGWVDDINGRVYLQDRHTIDRNIPILDTSQDLTLIEGEQYNNMTRIRFRRNKYVCNDTNYEDLPISKGTARILYAYNKYKDPLNEYFNSNEPLSIEWHGLFRGSKSVNINTGAPLIVDLSNTNTKSVDLLVNNITIPGDTDTTYYCKLYQLPQYDSMQHIVKFEPIVTPGNEAHVHHIVAYACPSNLITDASHIGHEQLCEHWEENMPSKECVFGSQTYVWNTGSEGFYLPNHVGLPMSGDSNLHYILLEIHYDNPQLLNNIGDSSGIRITYTNDLREYNAGHLNMLTTARPLAHIIPPHYKTVQHYAYIPPDCTARGIPNENKQKTYIIASMLHLHLIGKSTQISIIRNGTQLAPFDVNYNWDFNYQQFTRLHNEIQLLPNDGILLECNYSSINRNNITYGGLSTKDEMCTDNMYIYPVDNDFNFVETVYSGYNLEAISAWLTQAKAKGFITGNIPYVTDLWKAYRGMVKRPNLQWHDIDGAKEFYNELFTNPIYNKLNIYCADRDANLLTNPTTQYQIPMDFEPYVNAFDGRCNGSQLIDIIDDNKNGNIINNNTENKLTEGEVMNVVMLCLICVFGVIICIGVYVIMKILKRLNNLEVGNYNSNKKTKYELIDNDEDNKKVESILVNVNSP